MSQLDLFNGETPVDELDLRGHLAALAREERELGGRLSDDEAGAIIHERRNKHSRDARCEWCTEDGRDALERLRGRRGSSNGPVPGKLSSPRARSTDPATSHAAARTVADLRASQQAVLRCFEIVGPMTDEGLLFSYRHFLLEPRQSDSGLRTRRAELVDQGLLVDTGERGRTEAGRATTVWGRP